MSFSQLIMRCCTIRVIPAKAGISVNKLVMQSKFALNMENFILNQDHYWQYHLWQETLPILFQMYLH
jgi:hypothetical protein